MNEHDLDQLGPQTAEAIRELLRRLADYYALWPEDDAARAARVDALHVALIEQPRQETR